MLARYEMYYNDEYQGIGFLQGLDEVASPEKAKELIRPFDKKLKVPPYKTFKTRRTLSFFTKKGRKKFKKAIRAVKAAYKDDGVFEIKKLKVKQKDVACAILYKDKYQAIILEDVIRRPV